MPENKLTQQELGVAILRLYREYKAHRRTLGQFGHLSFEDFMYWIEEYSFILDYTELTPTIPLRQKYKRL